MYKQLYRIGIAAYGLLFILSVIFYKERTVFLDIAYHLFSIIQKNGFAIQNFRYVAIFTQLFPLAGIHIGLPLSSVALLYSCGFILYYFVCYFICGTILKQYCFALIILLFNVLFTTHTFYWIQSELPQTITLLLTLTAFMSYQKMSEISALSMAVIFFGFMTIQFSHPLVLFPATYIFLFFLLRKEIVIEHKAIYATALFFYAVVAMKKIVFSTGYDAVAMHSAHLMLKQFPHYFDIYANKRFLHDCLTRYYWIPLLSFAIAWTYSRSRAWMSLGFFVGFTCGYILLINIAYPDAAVPDIYMENLYLPVTIFLALPFVFDVLPLLSIRKLALPVMILIILTGCVRIFFAHNIYTSRLVWERSLLDKYSDKKVIIPAAKVPQDRLIMVWGTPYELWLLSTMEKGKSASIIVADDTAALRYTTGYNNQFVTTWGCLPYSGLSSKYFKFQDSVTNYIIISMIDTAH